jgi:hypothetical protein
MTSKVHQTTEQATAGLRTTLSRGCSASLKRKPNPKFLLIKGIDEEGKPFSRKIFLWGARAA